MKDTNIDILFFLHLIPLLKHIKYSKFLFGPVMIAEINPNQGREKI